MLSTIKSKLNAPNKAGLFYNIAAAVSLALLANLIIFVFGLNNSDYESKSFPVPGYIIGTVWIILFALMGCSRWLLNFSVSVKASVAKKWVTGLILGCSFYVFLLIFKSEIPGLIGNLITIVASELTVVKTYQLSKRSGWLIVPVIIWVIFATTLMLVTFY